MNYYCLYKRIVIDSQWWVWNSSWYPGNSKWIFWNSKHLLETWFWSKKSSLDGRTVYMLAKNFNQKKNFILVYKSNDVIEIWYARRMLKYVALFEGLQNTYLVRKNNNYFSGLFSVLLVEVKLKVVNHHALLFNSFRLMCI